MHYLAFLGVSLLVICSPGQDTALTIRNTLAGGRRAGIVTAAGVSIGQAIWTLAASAGLVVILVASEPVFVAIKLAGAAYLVYLGARSLLRAARREAGHDLAGRGASDLAPAAALRQGLLSDMSNAKMVAFFTSLLPQFAPPHPTFLVLLVLGLNFSLLTLAWLTGYALAVARVGDLLRRSSVRRTLDAVLGATLVGLGLRVAAETRSS